MPRSTHGGRHELGQNFLTHRPTARHIASLVGETSGPILEIGAGGGFLTRELAALGRPLIAIDIDEHRVRSLRRALPGVRVEHADVLRHALDVPTVVGNIPFHLTTPILRRLLTAGTWRNAVLLTQWEVARKRAGVGGRTMLTAQTAPWFEFSLEGRVPARFFSPMPGVDGGLLRVARRRSPLVPLAQRRDYERFVRAAFTGRGSGMARVIRGAARSDLTAARRAVADAGLSDRALPRDLAPEQWAALWRTLGREA